MKSKEELETLKKEYEGLNKKLMELSNDELEKVVGAEDRSKISPKRIAPSHRTPKKRKQVIIKDFYEDDSYIAPFPIIEEDEKI